MNNIWILTEERPKANQLKSIVEEFAKGKDELNFVDNLRIVPLMRNHKFIFQYELKGITSNLFNRIYIKLISGSSSFVDYLLYCQETEPIAIESPLYSIEATKTSDRESRNTSIYQRGTKFVFIESYYPDTKKYVLYDFKNGENSIPSGTNVFGTNLLLTLGVNFIGKGISSEDLRPLNLLTKFVILKTRCGLLQKEMLQSQFRSLKITSKLVRD